MVNRTQSLHPIHFPHEGADMAFQLSESKKNSVAILTDAAALCKVYSFQFPSISAHLLNGSDSCRMQSTYFNQFNQHMHEMKNRSKQETTGGYTFKLNCCNSIY